MCGPKRLMKEKHLQYRPLIMCLYRQPGQPITEADASILLRIMLSFIGAEESKSYISGNLV